MGGRDSRQRPTDWRRMEEDSEAAEMHREKRAARRDHRKNGRSKSGGRHEYEGGRG